MIEKKNKKSFDSVSLAIWAAGTLLGKTWRCRVISSRFCNPGLQNSTARIFCFWHSHLLPIAYAFRGSENTVVVSQSKDGKRAASVARLWKFDIIFGSSSKGGFSALRQCLRVLSSQKSIAITPDGPRGPREKVKPGVSKLVLLSRAPLITISALPKNAWYLRSWDRFMIPKPFSRVDILVSEPISYAENSVQNINNLIEERLSSNALLA